MRTLLVALLMGTSCGISLVSGQGFNRRYDTFGAGYQQGAYGIEPTAFGYLVLSGSYEPDTIAPDSIVGNNCIIFSGIDGTGEVLWEKKHSVHEKSIYLGWADCCDTVGGGFVSAGTIGGSDMIGSVRLMRYDANGDTLWVKEFGGPGETWVGSQVKRMEDNGFLVCGNTDAPGSYDGFVIRTDSVGSELWRQTYGWDVPDYIDGISSVSEAPNGDLYMSGTRLLSDEEGQHWVQRTDPDGALDWRVSWGGPYKEGATYLTLSSDGYPLVVGASSYAADYTDMRPYLAKLDTTDGALLWEKEYGEAEYSTLFFAAKECPNTDIIACGVNYQGAVERGMLLRATTDGDSLWMRNYNYHDDVIETGEGRFWDVLPTEDGGFIATGFMNGPYPPGFSQDAWVVKVDSLGCIVPGCDGVGVSELITNLKGSLTVYPNPTHAVVNIQLELPAGLRSGSTVLSIVASDGRVVRRTPWSSNASGARTLDVIDLSPGLYTLHITDGTTWITGTKLMIE